MQVENMSSWCCVRHNDLIEEFDKVIIYICVFACRVGPSLFGNCKWKDSPFHLKNHENRNGNETLFTPNFPLVMNWRGVLSMWKCMLAFRSIVILEWGNLESKRHDTWNITFFSRFLFLSEALHKLPFGYVSLYSNEYINSLSSFVTIPSYA